MDSMFSLLDQPLRERYFQFKNKKKGEKIVKSDFTGYAFDHLWAIKRFRLHHNFHVPFSFPLAV